MSTVNPSNPSSTAAVLLARLDELRTELVELAFVLDGRRRCDAADVAMTTSARIAEIHEEFAGKI